MPKTTKEIYAEINRIFNPKKPYIFNPDLLNGYDTYLWYSQSEVDELRKELKKEFLQSIKGDKDV